jgi:hypothetical protein
MGGSYGTLGRDSIVNEAVGRGEVPWDDLSLLVDLSVEYLFAKLFVVRL